MKIKSKKLLNNKKLFLNVPNYVFENKKKVIKSYLAKLLNVIYQYCSRGKKITFVNVPIVIINKMNKIIKKTPNIFFLPKNILIKGLISNQTACLYSNIKKKRNQKRKINFFFNFKTKSNLIVDCDTNTNNQKSFSLIKEAQQINVPTIFLNGLICNTFFNTPTYFIPNFFFLNNNIFYIILKSVLKRKKNLTKNSYIFKKKFFNNKNFGLIVKKRKKNFQKKNVNFK